MSRFIDKVGLEIEGCWAGTPGVSPFDFPLKQDVSVHPVGDLPHVGEAATPEPLDRSEAAGWLRAHWPTASDAFCGMHAHVSLKDQNLNYGRIISREFFDGLCKRLEDWGREKRFDSHHPFMHRLFGCKEHTLDGKPINRFCTRVFDPSTQMKLKEKTNDVRRSLLNYCFEMHGTVECRIWPMFTEGPEMAIEAVEVWFQWVEDFLSERERVERDGFRIQVRGRKKAKTSAQPPAPNPWGQGVPLALGLQEIIAQGTGPHTVGVQNFDWGPHFDWNHVTGFPAMPIEEVTGDD